MSELKVNKVTPRSGTTVTLGDSGDTITIPSGATITNSGTATGFGGGKVLQVVQSVATTAFSTTSSSLVDITGMSATITPSSASSKILITTIIPFNDNNNTGYPRFVLLRDSTQINLGASAGSATRDSMAAIRGDSSATITLEATTSCFLDSPNTTSAITYKWQTSVFSSRTAFFFVPASTVDANAHTASGTITLMEIAG
jgi:hypothetical protein